MLRFMIKLRFPPNSSSSFCNCYLGLQQAHDAAITALVIANGLLITASVDTTLKIWDLASIDIFDKSLKQVCCLLRYILLLLLLLFTLF